MKFRGALTLTGASMRSHKLRSLLATLGVVLGIASVIGVVTVGAGVQDSLLGPFRNQFGADIIAVSLDRNATLNGAPSSPPVFAFTDRDVTNIAKLPSVVEAGGDYPVLEASLAIGPHNLSGILTVADSHFVLIGTLEAGRTPQTSTEAVISNLTARYIRSVIRGSPVGQVVRVTWPNPSGGQQNASVTIVGVEAPSIFSTLETIEVGPQFAPFVTVGNASMHVYQGVAVRASSTGAIPTVQSEIDHYLETQSDARSRKGDMLVFRYDTQASVIQLVGNSVNQFTVFVGVLGGVALLVGLVGIANIMLVSVTERTREIGVMRATGATRGDVLMIFLTEAGVICLVGALLGIVIGIGMGLGLDQLVGSITSPPTNPGFVPVWNWYAIACGLGIACGVLAGLYPAWRATRVDPSQALGYE
ncbi:MAG: ABC transporter permease [Thermoplasmatota archaeon]